MKLTEEKETKKIIKMAILIENKQFDFPLFLDVYTKHLLSKKEKSNEIHI